MKTAPHPRPTVQYAPTTGSAASDAPNAAGRWNGTQVANAIEALEGPPIGDGKALASCIVAYAASHVAWQDFNSYISGLEDGGHPDSPPSVADAIANHAAACTQKPATGAPN